MALVLLRVVDVWDVELELEEETVTVTVPRAEACGLLLGERRPEAA